MHNEKGAVCMCASASERAYLRYSGNCDARLLHTEYFHSLQLNSSHNYSRKRFIKRTTTRNCARIGWKSVTMKEKNHLTTIKLHTFAISVGSGENGLAAWFNWLGVCRVMLYAFVTMLATFFSYFFFSFFIRFFLQSLSLFHIHVTDKYVRT